MTLFDVEKVRKVDENFLSALSADTVTHNFDFVPGSYCIIPTSFRTPSAEAKIDPILGPFELSVDTQNLKTLSLQALPVKTDWHLITHKGKWTKKN